MKANIYAGEVVNVISDNPGAWRFIIKVDSIHGPLVLQSFGTFGSIERATEAMHEFLSLVEKYEKQDETMAAYEALDYDFEEGDNVD